MSSMTSIERMSNILRRKKVDRIAFFEHYWKDTLKEWEQNKSITADESLEDHSTSCTIVPLNTWIFL